MAQVTVALCEVQGTSESRSAPALPAPLPGARPRGEESFGPAPRR
ncbi:hypothetical protein [Brachybacterium sacelli]